MQSIAKSIEVWDTQEQCALHIQSPRAKSRSFISIEFFKNLTWFLRRLLYRPIKHIPARAVWLVYERFESVASVEGTSPTPQIIHDESSQHICAICTPHVFLLSPYSTPHLVFASPQPGELAAKSQLGFGDIDIAWIAHERRAEVFDYFMAAISPNAIRYGLLCSVWRWWR